MIAPFALFATIFYSQAHKKVLGSQGGLADGFIKKQKKAKIYV